MQMIETSNFSHVSCATILSSTLNANRLSYRRGYRQSAGRASGISIYIVSRQEQLLATGELRLVSVKYSTPGTP